MGIDTDYGREALRCVGTLDDWRSADEGKESAGKKEPATTANGGNLRDGTLDNWRSDEPGERPKKVSGKGETPAQARTGGIGKAAAKKTDATRVGTLDDWRSAKSKSKAGKTSSTTRGR